MLGCYLGQRHSRRRARMGSFVTSLRPQVAFRVSPLGWVKSSTVYISTLRAKVMANKESTLWWLLKQMKALLTSLASATSPSGRLRPSCSALTYGETTAVVSPADVMAG